MELKNVKLIHMKRQNGKTTYIRELIKHKDISNDLLIVPTREYMNLYNIINIRKTTHSLSRDDSYHQKRYDMIFIDEIFNELFSYEDLQYYSNISKEVVCIGTIYNNTDNRLKQYIKKYYPEFILI